MTLIHNSPYKRVYRISVSNSKISTEKAIKQFRKFVMFDYDKWFLEERKIKLDKIFKR